MQQAMTTMIMAAELERLGIVGAEELEVGEVVVVSEVSSGWLMARVVRKRRKRVSCGEDVIAIGCRIDRWATEAIEE